MPAVITSVVALFLLFVGVTGANAATINVCSSGCTYTTIAAAATAAADGDTITVENGIYSGFSVNKQVTIAAKNFNQTDPTQNTATINSQITSSGSWAWDAGPVVRGFIITVTSDPVKMLNGPMTLEYNHIIGTGGDGVSFEGGGGIIRGNKIESGGDDGIDVDNQSKNILIEGNDIQNSSQDGIEIRQQPVTISSRISITFRNNRIEGSGQDGIQIMDYGNFTNRHYQVDHNLFLNNGRAAIGIMVGDVTDENYSASSMPEPLYAINNTFVGNTAGISGGANLVALNNIFSRQTNFDLKNVIGKSTVKYSLFAQTAKLTGPNNLDNATTSVADPLFDANYRLQNGSPAIDAGLAQYQHTYNYDGSGGGSAQTVTEYPINLSSAQYRGSAPDLGAYESNMTGLPPSTGPTSQLPSPTTNNLQPTTALGCRTSPARLTCFEAWRSAFTSGIFSSDADMNGSGTVTVSDFEVWRRAYTGV